MNPKTPFKIFLKVFMSLFFGGIFYADWLVAFLLFLKADSSFLEIIGWLLAPVVTALGFTVGIKLFDFLAKEKKEKFFHIYKWPLVGCVVGAGIVYWFGPMLIVFSMLVFGAISIFIREVLLVRKAN
ncbi:hypothetical protein [Candidatus Oleimmundimicrobium sp.]|uniref:hypothetical protein n=1 Tax=Candidatus Oleimmundimicrobium sp. TaxID=3060597 RepID=UPI002723764F|nr:hypothetical protein [Candidatus Oleimmundimicrobium sp.]MDO8886642.1 hypothetical protein [Candidatus Oleimmundimicrobium sp.]